MNYKTEIVKSGPGLTQHKALLALQNNRNFKPGTKIASFYNQGGHWVAKLMVPTKKAGWGDTIMNATGDFLSAPVDAAGGVVNAVGEAGKAVGDLAQGDFGGAASNSVGAVGELAGGVLHGLADRAQGALTIADQAGFEGADQMSQGIQNIVEGTGLPGAVTDAYKSPSSNQDFSSGDSSSNQNPGSSQGGDWRTGAAPDFSEDIEKTPANLHDEKHEELESSIEKEESHEDHEDSEMKKIKSLEKKIDLLLDALGISEKGENLDEKPEGPSADLPAAPPSEKGPKAGPKGSDPLPPGSGAKLKPGEVPNKPGITPVGAPAFASVQSFTASKLDAGNTLTIRQAKAQLENEFAGFRVARIKRDGDAIHARMVTSSDDYIKPDHTCSKCYNKGTCWADKCVNEHPKSSK